MNYETFYNVLNHFNILLYIRLSFQHKIVGSVRLESI